MPIIKKINHKNVELAIWRIEEPINYFHNKVYLSLSSKEKKEYDGFSNLNRKIEYLCSRYLLHLLSNSETRLIIKKENKKPTLKKSKKNISISHSKNYISVSISDNPHAIDIEDKSRISPSLIKVGAEKFYNHNFPINNYSHIELWLLGESLIKLGYNPKELENYLGISGLNFEKIRITENVYLGILTQLN